MKLYEYGDVHVMAHTSMWKQHRNLYLYKQAIQKKPQQKYRQGIARNKLPGGGGSDVVSVSCFGVRVSVMFRFMFVHYTFSSVWVAVWPPFGK